MPGWRRELSAQGRRVVILSGGELTVTMRGQGRGGPNQEYALALAIALGGAAGHRGAGRRYRRHRRRRGRPDDPAGAFVDADDAWSRAGRSASIPPRFSPTTIPRGFSTASATLFVPGPTCTNVNDFRAIVVDRP